MYGKKSNDPRLSMNTTTIAATYPRGLHGLGDTAIVLANGARVSGVSPARTNYQRPVTRQNGGSRVAAVPITTRASYPNGALIKGSGNAVYLMQNGQRRWVTDAAVFVAMGWAWSQIQTIPDAVLNTIPTGANVSSAADVGTGVQAPRSARPSPGYRLPVTSGIQNYSNGGANLAQLQQIAQTNPASLTPQQFAMLQAAGTIPGTLPYSSASQITMPAAADTTTAVVSATGLSDDYAGLPLWGWLAIAAGGFYLFTRSGRR